MAAAGTAFRIDASRRLCKSVLEFALFYNLNLTADLKISAATEKEAPYFDLPIRSRLACHPACKCLKPSCFHLSVLALQDGVVLRLCLVYAFGLIGKSPREAKIQSCFYGLSARPLSCNP